MYPPLLCAEGLSGTDCWIDSPLDIYSCIPAPHPISYFTVPFFYSPLLCVDRLHLGYIAVFLLLTLFPHSTIPFLYSPLLCAEGLSKTDYWIDRLPLWYIAVFLLLTLFPYSTIPFLYPPLLCAEDLSWTYYWIDSHRIISLPRSHHLSSFCIPSMYPPLLCAEGLLRTDYWIDSPRMIAVSLAHNLHPPSVSPPMYPPLLCAEGRLVGRLSSSCILTALSPSCGLPFCVRKGLSRTDYWIDSPRMDHYIITLLEKIKTCTLQAVSVCVQVQYPRLFSPPDRTHYSQIE